MTSARAWFAPVSYVLLTVLALSTLVPFFWMVLTALTPENEVMTRTWAPSRIAWENFPRAFTFFPFARFLGNTLVVAIGGTALHLITSCLAAYAFARLRFRGRELLFLLYRAHPAIGLPRAGRLPAPPVLPDDPARARRVGFHGRRRAASHPVADHPAAVQAGAGDAGRVYLHPRMELVPVAADRDHVARHARAVGGTNAVHGSVRHRVAPAHGGSDHHAGADAAGLRVYPTLLCAGHRPDWVWRTLNEVTTVDEGPIRAGAEQRPGAAVEKRMDWWRAARFGMFIHWGLYAIPAGQWQGDAIPGIGEWIMLRARIPVAEYEQLARDFNPVKFDADAWVALAKRGGQKYLTITSKHHDGFCMFDSKLTNYDIADATPFGRDPLKELAQACQKYDIKLCFYYSQT